MVTIFATLLVFALLMGGMALGLARGRPLRGSCGGTGEDCSCSALKRKQCERQEAAAGIVPDDGHRHLDVMSQEEDVR